jgi:TonB family protein
MSTDWEMKLAVWVLMLALWLVPIRANAQGEHSASQDELDDLRSLMTTAISAAREADHAKLEEIARNLMIPDYETWFKTTFGEELGARLTAAYKANFGREEKWLPRLFEWLAKQEGELEVEDANQLPRNMANSCGQTLMDAQKGNTIFYRVDLRKKESSGSNTVSSAGYFVMVQGGFRRLDCKSLGLQATKPMTGVVAGTDEQTVLTDDSKGTTPTRIRIGGNVQKAKLIERVQPKYPDEALNNRITGAVFLHIILEKDGTVKQVEVVSGHPLLVQAAIDAVRQWKYQPTLLNDEPVEVDTTVNVIFSLKVPQRRILDLHSALLPPSSLSQNKTKIL